MVEGPNHREVDLNRVILTQLSHSARSSYYPFSLDWPKSLFGFSRSIEKPEQTFWPPQCTCGASQVVLVVKNPLANATDAGDVGSIPGSGRSSGEENSNPLQYSCLENPMDKRSLVGYNP